MNHSLKLFANCFDKTAHAHDILCCVIHFPPQYTAHGPLVWPPFLIGPSYTVTWCKCKMQSEERRTTVITVLILTVHGDAEQWLSSVALSCRSQWVRGADSSHWELSTFTCSHWAALKRLNTLLLTLLSAPPPLLLLLLLLRLCTEIERIGRKSASRSERVRTHQHNKTSHTLNQVREPAIISSCGIKLSSACSASAPLQKRRRG